MEKELRGFLADVLYELAHKLRNAISQSDHAS